jgi:hypothetical protein
VALQQTFAIDVEGLVGAVRSDTRGKADLQATPGFPAFRPRCPLFAGDVRPGQEEGQIEMRPP